MASGRHLRGDRAVIELCEQRTSPPRRRTAAAEIVSRGGAVGRTDTTWVFAFTFAIGVFAAATIGVALPARAQGFDVENAPPVLSPTSYASVESSGILPGGAFAVGSAIGYTLQPLVLRDVSTNLVDAIVVRDRVTNFLGVAAGIGNRFEASVRGSFVPWQRGDFAVFGADGMLLPAPRAAFGDTFVRVKARLIGEPGESGLHMALLTAATIPTGSPASFTGDRTYSLRPQALIGWDNGRLFFDAFVGYNFRPRHAPAGAPVVVANEIALGGGFAWAARPDFLWLLAEVRLAVGRGADSDGAFPAEALLGGRMALGGALLVQAGVGTAISAGYGAPLARGLFEVAYVWGRTSSRPAEPEEQPREAAPREEALPQEPLQPGPAQEPPSRRVPTEPVKAPTRPARRHKPPRVEHGVKEPSTSAASKRRKKAQSNENENETNKQKKKQKRTRK